MTLRVYGSSVSGPEGGWCVLQLKLNSATDSGPSRLQAVRLQCSGPAAGSGFRVQV